MIMFQPMQRAFLLAAGFAIINTMGCASPASRESMSVQNVTVIKKHPYSVSVETKGGSETSAIDSPGISDADLKAAIEKSIIDSSLFKNIVQGKGGDYLLTVRVTQVSKPLFAIDMKVDLETAWSLLRVADNSIVMRKVIKTTHVSTMGDSVVGVTRLRLAVEGAARENIAQGIKAISELDL